MYAQVNLGDPYLTYSLNIEQISKYMLYYYLAIYHLIRTRLYNVLICAKVLFYRRVKRMLDFSQKFCNSILVVLRYWDLW